MASQIIVDVRIPRLNSEQLLVRQQFFAKKVQGEFEQFGGIGLRRVDAEALALLFGQNQCELQRCWLWSVFFLAAWIVDHVYHLLPGEYFV